MKSVEEMSSRIDALAREQAQLMRRAMEIASELEELFVESARGQDVTEPDQAQSAIQRLCRLDQTELGTLLEDAETAQQHLRNEIPAIGDDLVDDPVLSAELVVDMAADGWDDSGLATMVVRDLLAAFDGGELSLEELLTESKKWREASGDVEGGDD